MVTISSNARIIEPIKIQMVIRKIETDDNGHFVAKYGLSKSGEWILVPEGTTYPEECLFETQANYEPTSYPPLGFEFFDSIEIVAHALDTAERQGSDKDEPEGKRFAVFSDTLLKQLSNRLWSLLWPSKIEQNQNMV